MTELSTPRVLVVYKRSAYQQFAQHRSRKEVDRLLSKFDPSVSHIFTAHENHLETVRETKSILKNFGAQATFKRRAEKADVEQVDLVITLGGDGTLLHASHAVGTSVPMLAINSAPGLSVGYFCGGTRFDLAETLSAALKEKLKNTSLSRMRIDINQKTVSTRVLNDALFAHHMPSLPCTYQIHLGNKSEEQRSSGVWVGPAAGSTAAQHSAGGKILPLQSKKLQFVIREPYFGVPPLKKARSTKLRDPKQPQSLDKAPAKILKGLIQPGHSLKILTKIRDAELFIDGSHQVFPLHIGSTVEFSLSAEPLTLLGKVASPSERQ